MSKLKLFVHIIRFFKKSSDFCCFYNIHCRFTCLHPSFESAVQFYMAICHSQNSMWKRPIFNTIVSPYLTTYKAMPTSLNICKLCFKKLQLFQSFCSTFYLKSFLAFRRVCLSVPLSIYLSIHLSIPLFIHLSTQFATHITIHLIIHLFIHVSVNVSMDLPSIHPYIHLYSNISILPLIYPCIYSSTHSIIYQSIYQFTPYIICYDLNRI